MKLPFLPSKGPDNVLTREARTKVERRVIDTLRTASTFLTKVADLVEAARLSREGYEQQGKFLTRLDREERERQQREAGRHVPAEPDPKRGQS